MALTPDPSPDPSGEGLRSRAREAFLLTSHLLSFSNIPSLPYGRGPFTAGTVPRGYHVSMRYAAFLRAINVGRNNRITMAALREVCAEAGFGEVRTYLQTGNVLFESDLGAEDAAVAMESALAAYGLKNAPAVVRTLAELEAIVGGEPFGAFPAESYTRYVTLFRKPLPAGAATAAHDVIHVVSVREREVLAAMPLERPQGVDINGWLSKQTRMEGTTRYFHVVEEVARQRALTPSPFPAPGRGH